MFDTIEYKRVINVPLAVIIASFIIIIITTGMTNKNGISALIGGYTGLLLGLLFVIILNIPNNNWLNFVPIVYIIVIVSLLMTYLYKYFGEISNGHVSSYYGTFSNLSTIFLVAQVLMLFSSFTNGSINNLSNKTFSLLSLFATINFIIVITLGIVLHFYSTQGFKNIYST
jgi:uncharacterized membrane protein YoaK (UPF0700 family)